MGDATHQFNNVNYDFTNTPLYNIKMEGNEVPSTRNRQPGVYAGNDRAFSETQVSIPPGHIMHTERWKVLKAELIVEPVPYSYELFGLPDSLYILKSNKEQR